MPNLKILPKRGADFSSKKYMDRLSPQLPAHMRDKNDKIALADATKKLERKIKYGYLSDNDIREAARNLKGNKGITETDVKFYKETLKGYTREAERKERTERMKLMVKKEEKKIVPKYLRAKRDDEVEFGGMNFAKSGKAVGISIQPNTGMKYSSDRAGKPAASILSGKNAKASVLQKDGPSKSFRPIETAGPFGRG